MVGSTFLIKHNPFCVCMYFLPMEGLYPPPWFRVTEAYGIGTLVLKGPKHFSVCPAMAIAMFGSMVALKETIAPAEVKRDG